MTTQDPIRLLIVDDHAVVRSGLATFLMVFDDLELVGEASSGEGALDLCRRMKPDVVLMDLLMPGMNGVEATRRIHETFPNLPVIFLSAYDDEEMQQMAFQAGAEPMTVLPSTSETCNPKRSLEPSPSEE